ncbi:MAG: VapC toxin family PIN domain ribonuclease [Desulfobulbaceae bacterium A2]|nr:MAG: VapC toxin family PIN domain ribonuclease [Desulfobulbaceae bacterium A2]
MLKYMLDTNTLVYAMKNRSAHVKKRFNQHAGQMCISSISLGELVFGAEHSQQVERNLADIDMMIAQLEVLPFGMSEANHFGRIRSERYRIGQPIGPYDMMIAGHARATGMILVTNNEKAFVRVQGLLIENWCIE